MARYYEGGTIPWVKSGELKEAIVTRTAEYLTEAALKETNVKVIPAGALLVAMYGATVGRLGILGIPATTNQAVCHIIPDPQVASTRYLFHALSNQVSHLVARRVGGAQPNISQGIIRDLGLPLPPLSQQLRIAAILDKVEEVRAKRRTAMLSLSGLTQAIFLEMFGDPITNRRKWKTKPLTDVCRGYSGGTPSRSNETLWQGNTPWFSPKDMKHSDLFDSQEHVSDTVSDETNIRLLPMGTVVIVVRGMILARSFPVAVLRTEGFINQDMKALLPCEAIEPQFLASCLRCEAAFVLQQVSEAGHGTKRLDAEGLSRVPIILPPIELQQEFITRVLAAQRLKASCEASQLALARLFESIQHRAFAGEL